ncbi:hypothetical protein GALMADRAFT_230044 [Galerina marginata CBS 339.88]|uniref:Uncharacterized protein n=1 Tax=Galerina marginata (strain CBS 339.88) TaxID=685588 RepID=A0A067SHE3_GALM3|nr:hypothetical protein GALMADRAFT_230044 [Galerina marginata CBS 339.88]
MRVKSSDPDTDRTHDKRMNGAPSRPTYYPPLRLAPRHRFNSTACSSSLSLSLSLAVSHSVLIAFILLASLPMTSDEATVNAGIDRDVTEVELVQLRPLRCLPPSDDMLLHDLPTFSTRGTLRTRAIDPRRLRRDPRRACHQCEYNGYCTRLKAQPLVKLLNLSPHSFYFIAFQIQVT